MTTSKEGFPLKAEGGEDLLKGLKDLKLKLTENADIVQKYMEAVEKFLPGMTAMLGLTVSDFTLDKESLFDLRDNMLEGEYSPIVYRAEKDGGKYEAAIWILKEAYGFSVHSSVVKNKDGQSWLYNSDRQNWEIIETEMDLSPRMEEILQSGPLKAMYWKNSWRHFTGIWMMQSTLRSKRTTRTCFPCMQRRTSICSPSTTMKRMSCISSPGTKDVWDSGLVGMVLDMFYISIWIPWIF